MKLKLALFIALISLAQCVKVSQDDLDTNSAKLEDAPPTASGLRVHLSSHFTLEYALAFDPESLSTPDCQESVEFDKAEKATQEWIELLSDPSNIQEDIDLLSKIRALIVAAKGSIEETEADFKKQTTSFAQVQIESTAQIQTQVIHRVFGDQMEEILAQLDSLNNSQLEHSELVEMADNIIAAIDALVVELQDLQKDSDNFQSYVDQLANTVTAIRVERENCYGTTVADPEPIDSDKKVSSATLDDFDQNAGEKSSSSAALEDADTTETGEIKNFVANSGSMSFAQQKSHLRKNSSRLSRK